MDISKQCSAIREPDLVRFTGTIEDMPFKLLESEKFGIVAVHNAYIGIANEHTQLSDGTWVLQSIPFEIEKTWKKWLGSLKTEQLAKSNLVLIRTKPSKEPKILDGEHEELGRHLDQLFHTLQIGGISEYETADLLKGSFYDGSAEIRQRSEIRRFFPCKGYSR